MSEPELAYMTGNNEDFDLPRWQTHNFQDTLSSTAQAAQAAQQGGFTNSLYNPAPPPQSQLQSQAGTSPHRLPPIISAHHSASTQSGASRQARISQILDEEQQLGQGPHQFLSAGQTQLSRSASLGGGIGGAASGALGRTGVLSSRIRRNHPPDDLESAFTTDNAQGSASPRHHQHQPPIPSSLYPSSVTFSQPQQPHMPSTPLSAHPTGTTTNVGELFHDAQQFPNQNPGPRGRSQTFTEHGDSGRTARNKATNPSTPIHDPYSHIPAQGHGQFSPTTNYQYSNSGELQSAPPYPYHSSQSQPHVKTEPVSTPLTSPYTGHMPLPPPQPAGQSSSNYSPSYPMDTSSPGPSGSSQNSPHHLTSHSQPRQHSVSTPNTPFSSNTSHSPQPNPGQYFGSVDQTAMAVELPHKRQTGFRRLRDHRDLQPYVNARPGGRRDDGTGVLLSVSGPCTLCYSMPELACLPAITTTHNEHHRHIPYLQPFLQIRIGAQPSTSTDEAQQTCSQ